MATELCQKCKQTHPGRNCDYDDKGDCAETVEGDEKNESSAKKSKAKDEPVSG
jgi:hypothetical protein